MPSSCAVPGCQSNYKSTDSVKVFKFPAKGTSLFETWMRKIPRKDWIPGSRSVVCIKHFRDEDVIKEDVFPMPDGTVRRIPRQRFKLAETAVPCIFPNLPSHLSDSISTTSRKDPTIRKEQQLMRQQLEVDNFLKEDLVLSFENLKENINIAKKDWLFYIQDNRITFYRLNIKNVPISVRQSISIERNLSLNVFFENKQMIQELKWLFKCNTDKVLYLERYSQLENLFSWLDNQEEEKEDLLNKLIKDFGECVKAYDNTLSNFGVLTFLYEQLLLNFNNNAPRYSPKMLSWAFSLYLKSPKCYSEILSSGILVLPKERYLRKISSVLSFTGRCDEADHQNYLKSKCAKLPDSDRQVNLLIDEIVVRPHISYSSNSLCGISVNKKLKRATSVQSFMITSIYSSNKDVAAMIPVHNSNAEELLQWTKKVIKVVQECGYIIVSIITDNNRVNRNMLTSLCGGILQTSIQNPSINGKIFILFDTVHIIKSIRNNWINQRTSYNTLFFPSFDNFELQFKASFADLVFLYEKEKDSIIKFAPKLNFKALNPNNFERQNVALCLRIFDDSNIAALKALNNPEYEGTVKFLEIISNWWKIVNIKNTRKGFEHLNTLEMPFKSIDDVRLVQLSQIVSWLEAWKDIKLPFKGNRSGKLSEETFCSLTHTTKALKEIILHRLSVLKDEYVLTGKYQTDPIEGRFGQYRQMHGGSYNITVEQVLRSEKKLRLKSLIEMHSSKYGNFRLKNFLVEFCDVANNIETFEIDLKGIDFFEHTEEEEEMFPIFIYICGYAAYKMKSKLTCSSCTNLFVTDKEILFELSGEAAQNYLINIDRGNLTYSDDEIVRVFIVCYKIFTFFLNEENEDLLHLPQIKCILKQLIIQKIEELDICRIGKCEACYCSKFDLAVKFIPIFLNIFFNNYSLAKNDSFVSAKGSKRKYSILESSSSEK